MSDSGPKTGLRQALGTADLDPDDEVHYLAMLLGEAKRYDGAWDGDPEGAARWAVAQWCQEIGYVPTLAEFDAGEQVGKAETPPNCEAAFRSEGCESSIEPVVREIVEALYTVDDAVVVRAENARQAAEIHRQIVHRVPEETLNIRVQPEVVDEEEAASEVTYRLSLRRLIWDRDEGWFGEDAASGTHFDLTDHETSDDAAGIG